MYLTLFLRVRVATKYIPKAQKASHKMATSGPKYLLSSFRDPLGYV